MHWHWCSAIACAGARTAKANRSSARCLTIARKNSTDLAALRKNPSLYGELDHDRHVIGRLVEGPGALVDGRRGEPVGGERRQEHVVDADAVVLLPGAGLIVPEGVVAG